MKSFLSLIVIAFWGLIPGRVKAQDSFSIAGAVIDTALNQSIKDATVYVLNARDSMLVQFDYSDNVGSFTFRNLPLGQYILLVTYPGYADYVTPFTLDAAHSSLNMGKTPLQQKGRLLQEVMIKGQVTAIKIKGDTTEFNAKAYVIQPNDKVEDLLKKLPGLQVDQNGKITTNGETITKVLVDGEEFFGDDPTLVTRNIRADMVDKIQLYDKKSDQATFTGVDDGKRTKTINVKLKEDKKNGLFGKVDAGYGSQGYYQAQGMYNRFTAAQKYAAYGTIANTGKVTLGATDSRNLNAGSNNIQVGDVIVVPGLNDDQDAVSVTGNYSGNGLPISRTGGGHFDGKFNGGDASLNANYKAGSFGVQGTQTIQQQRSLPGGNQNSYSARSFNNNAFRQKLDFAYQTKLDTASNLKIAADGTLKAIQTQSNLQSQTLDSALLNTEDQQVNNNGNQRVFDASIFYTHKFRKPGRTFSWNLSEAYNQSQTHGYQHTTLRFYQPDGSLDTTEVQDQFKTSTISSSIASSNMTWSEPIFKTLAVVFNYGLGINNSDADRATYNPAPNGSYSFLDTLYSNNYRFNQLTNQLGAIFSYKEGKTLLTFGAKGSQVSFKQINLYNNSIYPRNFINWAPQALFQYQFAQRSSININYNGGTAQPSIEQIQPVRVNSDPLNIIIGNPALKPSFSNSFRLGYRSYAPISKISLTVNGSYSMRNNAIVHSNITDSVGKTTTQYVNLGGYTPYSYSLASNISFSIPWIDANLEMEAGTTGTTGYSLINRTVEQNNTRYYYMYAQVRKSKEKVYDISWVLFNPSYQINTFSLQPRQNNNARGFYSDGYFTLYLPAKFQLNGSYNFNYAGKTPVLPQQSKMIVNTGLAKTFLKNDNLKLSVNLNDILNQNQGYSRSVSANTITQSSYSTVGRYLLFSLTWDFSKFGTSKP